MGNGTQTQAYSLEYVWEDNGRIMHLLFFYGFWMLIQVLPFGAVRNIFKVLAGCSAALLFLSAFVGMLMSSPEWRPYIGYWMAFLFLPLLIIAYWFEYKTKGEMELPYYSEELLDDYEL